MTSGKRRGTTRWRGEKIRRPASEFWNSRRGRERKERFLCEGSQVREKRVELVEPKERKEQSIPD